MRPRLPCLLAAALLAGCAPLNELVDHWALGAMAGIAQRGATPTAGPLPYADAAALERLTRPEPPVAMSVEPEPRPIADDRLTQERLTFESAVKLRFASSDRAVAHAYRGGEWGRRPALLWVPGQAIGDKDWPSLNEYFQRVLDLGVDVVFYEPPYHFSRAPEGTGSGDAMLSTDFADHLGVFAQEISDLRRLAAWLRAQGVTILGGFGSSMGGGMLMRALTFEPIVDFLVLKQPLVDWNAVIQRPEMAPVRARIEAQGVSPEAMARAYRALDSRGDAPKIPAARIALLYGRYDQVAPEDQARALARSWGIADVYAYQRGHALITLGGGTYRDVPRAVRANVAALRMLRSQRK